jgi:hypothetical protein
MSELFAPGRDSLVIYSFMFPRDPGDGRPGPAAGRTALLPLAEGPCPSCVALLDQFEGITVVVEDEMPAADLVYLEGARAVYSYLQGDYIGVVLRLEAEALKLHIPPGDVDWFDDAGWEAIASNDFLVAKIGIFYLLLSTFSAIVVSLLWRRYRRSWTQS